VTQDWAAVAKAINERVTELGWRQRELATRSHVSQAVVRELQHHVIERRRSARTLEALSTALGWHPRRLHAILEHRRPPELGDPSAEDGETVRARLDALELRLSEITESLDGIRTDIRTVIELVSDDR
jgi:transcriptional regulator with XRE-family HTH domain